MALDHYVSQVHLKKFYSPALGELMYAMRKSDLERFTPRAKSVCRLDEGNTNDYLTEPRAVEEFLKPVEGRYDAAISAFEASKPNQNAIYAIAGFVSYILTCSPAAMRIASGTFKADLKAAAKLKAAMEEIPTPPPELGGKELAELLDSGAVKVEIDPKYPQAVGIAGILQQVALFGNSKWDILINEHEDCPFFTSDFPVGSETTSNLPVLNRVVPLAPTVAVRITPNTNLGYGKVDFEFRHFSFERRKVKRQEAVNINRLLVQSAEDMVFFRDDQAWIPRFIEKNRHFRMETETVEIPKPQGVVLWSRQTLKPFQRG
ncbi:MAG: DUF4238 domain-containing protein [Pseudolabrys sp.]